MRCPPACLPQARQLLQQVPVLEPVLLGPQQGFGGIAITVEVLGKTALAAREVDERDLLFGLGVHVPVVLGGRVTLQGKVLLDGASLAGIVDQERKSAAVDGEASLV